MSKEPILDQLYQILRLAKQNCIFESYCTWFIRSEYLDALKAELSTNNKLIPVNSEGYMRFCGYEVGLAYKPERADLLVVLEADKGRRGVALYADGTMKMDFIFNL